MKELYVIGGSPCCGKSTIAKALAQKHGLHYFDVDKKLFDYLGEGAQGGDALLARELAMSPEELWMRSPTLQCEEELEIYRRIFPSIFRDLAVLKEERIIAEAAAFLPEMINARKSEINGLVYLVPQRDFQIKYYSQRPWIGEILKNTSNRDQAFSNWMERDALFALEVKAQAEDLGYPCRVVDGGHTLEENTQYVEATLGLG